MRILLLNPLIQASDWENDVSSKWPPLGLAYIAAVLERAGHEIKIIERRIFAGSAPRTPENVAKVDALTVQVVKEFAPQIAGITATTPLIMDAFHSAGLIKEVDSSIKVALGGCHPTAEPESSLESCPAVDIAVRGEGEQVMLDLAEGLALEKIDGITYRQNKGKISVNKNRRVLDDLDSLPYPARHLLDRDFYFRQTSVLIRGFYGRGATIFAARGCPYQCSFCQAGQLSRANDGKFVRFRSPERVIEEVSFMRSEYGIELLVFAEDIFSIQKERMIRICDLLIEKNLNKHIKFAVNLRVDSVDMALLNKLKAAGCARVIYGCESGSQRTLESMRKKTTVEKNLKAVKLTKEAGISCEVNMIIGLPGETEEDFLQTISFLKKARPDMINRAKLNPLPSTFYFEQLLKDNIIKKPADWDEIVKNYVVSDFTFAKMSREQFRRLKDKMDREVTLPANYIFKIKANFNSHPLIAVQQLLLLFVHCSVLYLPVFLRDYLRRISEILRIKSRFVFK